MTSWEQKLKENKCGLYMTVHANGAMVDDNLENDDIRKTIIAGEKNKNHNGPGNLYRYGVIEVVAYWIPCHCTVITAYNKNNNGNSPKDKSWRRRKFMDKEGEKTCPRCGKADLVVGEYPLVILDNVIGDFPGLGCTNCELVCFDEKTSIVIRNVIKDFEMRPINSEEQCLLLLFASSKPIRGATVFMKEVFLLFKEKLNEFNIPALSPHFIPYHYGPYSFDIESAWHTLDDLGLIKIEGQKSSKSESFYLTEEGMERAKEIFNSMPVELQESLYEWRRGLDELGRDGILKLVYQKYPYYRTKSKIIDDVLPNWAHRRA